jgi:hypothetical protein
LRREDWALNNKRIQRLWREAGLKVPASRERKQRRLGTSENGCTRRRAQYVEHVWSYDFAMDATEDARRLKVMPIVDEYSRYSEWGPAMRRESLSLWPSLPSQGALR